VVQPYDPSSSPFPMLDLVRWLTLHNQHDGVIVKIWIMCFILSVRVPSVWLLGSSSTPGVYQLGLKQTKTPPSSGKVESEWSHTSIPPCAFMMCTGTTLPCLRVSYFTKGVILLFQKFICMTSLFGLCLQLNVLMHFERCLFLQMQHVLIWLLAWRGFFFFVVFLSLSR